MSGVGDCFRVYLSRDVLDYSSIINFVRTDKCGAISTFIGTTRDNFEDKSVTYLAYEAYDDMAMSEMLSICESIQRDYDGIHKIYIAHKIGECPVGDISVVIAVSSEHRKEGLAAVSFAIDELKKRVPIWKKEHYKEGDPLWKDNKVDGFTSANNS